MLCICMFIYITPSIYNSIMATVATRRALSRAWIATNRSWPNLKRPSPSSSCIHSNNLRQQVSCHRSYRLLSFSTASSLEVEDIDSPLETIPSPPPGIQSAYDASPDWEDWFSPEEYGPPFEYSYSRTTDEGKGNGNVSISQGSNKYLAKRRPMLLEPLDDDPSMDASSRHLIRQLQILYHDGFNRDEVITPRRCHHAMLRLFSSAEEIAKLGGTQANGAVMVRQRVMRAVAIFRLMETFWDFVPDVVPDERSKSKFKKSRITKHSSNRNRQRSSKWPLPTYEMYVNVLQELAGLRATKQYDKVQNTDVPWLCQEIMLRSHKLHHSKGMVYLKRPPIEAWNQVLLAWANAHGDRDHPEKALHATQFFLDMKLHYKVTPDASSYSHVLRACAHGDQNKVAEELGAKLAVRLWTGVMKDELQLRSFLPTPYTYVFFLRAVCKLPDNMEAQRYLREAWESACSMGVINEHVLYELEQSSDVLFQELLQTYQDKLTPEQRIRPQGPYDKTYHMELMKVLPDEWKRWMKNRESSSKLPQSGTNKGASVDPTSIDPASTDPASTDEQSASL